MRDIPASAVTAAVKALCVPANNQLPPDVEAAVRGAYESEPVAHCKADAGHAVPKPGRGPGHGPAPSARIREWPVYLPKSARMCISPAVPLKKRWTKVCARAIPRDICANPWWRTPSARGNTGDNTPAVLTVRLVPGDKLRLTLAPKGFGSENMSRLAMLRPSDGEQGVKDFVLDAVRRAGPNPCPPVVVGVGIGGTFDRVALLAKRALLRPLGSRHPDPYYAAMEQELLEKINELGTGPQGFGGRTTALGLQIETFPTHIAGLPVAVNINCHVTRHAEVVL